MNTYAPQTSSDAAISAEPFRSKMKININLVFILLASSYLSPLVNVGCISEIKEKNVFSLYFTRFSLPLSP